jgi:hypothetical protein
MNDQVITKLINAFKKDQVKDDFRYLILDQLKKVLSIGDIEEYLQERYSADDYIYCYEESDKQMCLSNDLYYVLINDNMYNINGNDIINNNKKIELNIYGALEEIFINNIESKFSMDYGNIDDYSIMHGMGDLGEIEEQFDSSILETMQSLYPDTLLWQVIDFEGFKMLANYLSDKLDVTVKDNYYYTYIAPCYWYFSCTLTLEDILLQLKEKDLLTPDMLDRAVELIP